MAEGEGWKVEFSRRAEKELGRLIRSLGRERVEKDLQKVMDILRDPIKNRHRLQKVKGSKKGLLKMRIGSLRVAVKIYEKKRLVEVISIGFRESFYEKL